MTETDDPRHELEYLVRAFDEHLRTSQRRGRRWVGAGPSPRASATQGVEDGQSLETEGVESARDLPAAALAAVRTDLGDCQRCRLSASRKSIVFGVGKADADLVFIGEAPGRDEDLQGEPFVGKAGQLFTKMLRAMGLEREDVYICNILKCRPPQNRDPTPEEVATCGPFLTRQIEAIAPRFLIAMGNFAAKTLLRTDTGITRLRGTFHDFHGVPLMPTFHPAYLLRNPEAKRPVWNDLQTIMAEMDRLGLYRRRG